MSVVCIDPHSGTLRRYVRAAGGKVKMTNVAQLCPWPGTPPHEFEIDRAEVELFRVGVSQVPSPLVAA